MSLSIYVAAPEGRTGKSIVALGIIDALSRQVASIGVFRPLVKGDTPRDEVLESLLRLPGVKQDYASAVGVTYAEARANPDDVLSRLVNQYGELKERFDAIVVVGSDFADTMSHNELALNAQFAANFGAPVVLTVAGKRHRTPEQVKAMALSALAELERNHARTIGIVATRLDQEVEEATLAELSTIPGVIVSAVETDPSLSSPTFGAQVAAVEGEIFSGRREQLQRESRGVMIAGMTLQNALKGLFQEATVVVPGDRFEMIPAILMAHNATTFPDLSGLILVGGYDLPDSITKLIGTIRHDLPIAISRLTTWQAAQQLFAVEGAMTNSPRKAELALAAVSRTIDLEGLLTRAAEVGSSVTPLMFEYKLNEMARRNKRTIVLPEAEDDRILTSAAIALKRGIANIILLGKPEAVTARAEELGLDLSQAQVVDPEDPEMLERFAAEYARLRAHKGVTVEAARARFADKSYIGTMMVHMGVAHGMVSGAVNTTANTIRPSLEFIKTKPGVKVVSSSFLMCMNDRVDVYADCAVNPNPTPEELADIAIGAAETAIAFDIEPRIAMLSYSTGTSGAGGDVEAVAEATRLVRERAPELAVEGPIQFDAAIDLTVGQKKMPGSAVAGRATVFIFPDLNTGNNTYKAVQRTAGAVAIGPVLQGLNKPVNDLSRGALVEDIVNTIAITAIQAQQQ